MRKKYPQHRRRSGTRPHIGLRDGQGPFSNKKWISDLFEDWRKSKSKHTDLFQSPAQAQRAIYRFDRAIRQAERRGIDVMKKLVTPKDVEKAGKGQISGPPIPRHIHERAMQARFYLQQARVAEQ